MNLPLVTVGVASYNNALYLRETLESIRLQTYVHLELLIVDDASSDDSVTVAETWLAAHLEVNGRIIRHSTNLGICRVCNDIVTQAKGEFICIIGSDDVYLPDKLAVQVPLLRDAPPEVGVVYSAVGVIGPKGEPLPPAPEWGAMAEGNIFLQLLQNNFVPAMSTLVRRSCFERVGHYDESLSFEDADMWLRIARQYEFKYSNVATAKYRRHSMSATHGRIAIMIESSLRHLYKYWGERLESDRIIVAHTRLMAEHLYQLGSSQALHWLQIRWQQNKDLSSFALLALATLGVPGGQVMKLQRFLGR